MSLVDEFSVLRTVIAGNPVRCAIYKMGNIYHCVVTAESQDVHVARSSGATADAALSTATREAEQRFSYE